RRGAEGEALERQGQVYRVSRGVLDDGTWRAYRPDAPTRSRGRHRVAGQPAGTRVRVRALDSSLAHLIVDGVARRGFCAVRCGRLSDPLSDGASRDHCLAQKDVSWLTFEVSQPVDRFDPLAVSVRRGSGRQELDPVATRAGSHGDTNWIPSRHDGSV